MRIWITGASGFVGSHLVPALRSRGNMVVGLDRQELSQGTEIDGFIEVDLSSPTLPHSLETIESTDLLVHLAAAKSDWGLSEETYRRDNVEATRNLLHLAERRGVKKHIFFSTVAVHGPSLDAVSEDGPPNPNSAYGETKLECERIYGRFAEAHPDSSVLIIRPSVIFGIGHPSSTNIYRLVEALRRRVFLMVGDGSTIKTTSYIENVVAATLFLMERITFGLDVYTYVDSPALTTAQLVERICLRLGRRVPRFHIPLRLAGAGASVFDFIADSTGVDLPITSARIHKFCRGTNYSPGKIITAGFQQPISVERALDNTVDWHLSRR